MMAPPRRSAAARVQCGGAETVKEPVMPDGIDKRRYPRIVSKNAVLVTRLGDDVLEDFARTEVVGLGGCMFASDEPYGLGAGLDLLITIAHEVVKVRTKVVYEKEVDGRWEVGVEFLNLSDQERQWIGVLLEDQQSR
jgi:hypothetical protein